MKTILVVDDSSTMRSATARVLKDAGYTVLEAKDGEEALQVAERNKQEIKLIISDINMPKMDGLQFLGALKATPHGKFLPVVMLTTESQREKVEKAKTAGAKAFMVKPFSETQLTEAVKRLIG
jgi:two-component system chemotaxis response regulator CheY